MWFGATVRVLLEHENPPYFWWYAAKHSWFAFKHRKTLHFWHLHLDTPFGQQLHRPRLSRCSDQYPKSYHTSGCGLGVLGCRVSLVVVESWMMVDQLWMQACWPGSNYGQLPCRTVWKALLSHLVGHSPSCRPARFAMDRSRMYQRGKCTISLTWLGLVQVLPACQKDQSRQGQFLH